VSEPVGALDGETAYIFKKKFDGADTDPDAVVDDMTDYHLAFVDVWYGYNSGEAGYGSDVGGRVSRYESVPARSLF